MKNFNFLRSMWTYTLPSALNIPDSPQGSMKEWLRFVFFLKKKIFINTFSYLKSKVFTKKPSLWVNLQKTVAFASENRNKSLLRELKSSPCSDWTQPCPHYRNYIFLYKKYKMSEKKLRKGKEKVCCYIMAKPPNGHEKLYKVTLFALNSLWI